MSVPRRVIRPSGVRTSDQQLHFNASYWSHPMDELRSVVGLQQATEQFRIRN
jgi:hypothetical protein